MGRDRGAVALCLEVHDLVLAKCVAGRERDWDFARIAVEEGLVEVEELFGRIPALPEPADQDKIRKALEGLVKQVGGGLGSS